jgi:Domain of unknown function (DUF4190)
MASTPQSPERPGIQERTTTPSAPPSAGASQEKPGKAIASLVLGILGVLTFLIPIVAIILGILAIVFGSTSRNEIRRRGLAGHGQATAGLVLGVIAVLLGLAIWIIGVAVATS